MRIALCLFGLYRSFDKVWPIMYKNLIEPNEENNQIDIFICTSNLYNHKTRFKVDKISYLNKDNILSEIKNLIGKYLKKIEIIDDSQMAGDASNRKHYWISRAGKIYKTLKLKSDYEKENNFKYDIVILHRFDIVFAQWQLCDKYYEPKIVGQKRLNGLIYKNNVPIGVKEHGCVSIQTCPKREEINVSINLPEKMENNEIHCYEDFWIGHLPIDFFYSNSYTANLISKFFLNLIRNILPSRPNNRTNRKLNTLQSYEYNKDDWYLYSDLREDVPEKLFKYYLVENNIKTTKELRKIMDIGVLYIR